MIHLECYNDQILVQAFGFVKKSITHSGDKGKVCNDLNDSIDSIGLIDEDPESAQPKYIDTCEVIKSEHDVVVRFHKKKRNILIILCPRLEEWVLQTAREAQTDITQYDLPDNPKELHSISKQQRNRLLEFIKVTKRNSPRLKLLEKLLKRQDLDI
jgi:hypothetical protein